MILGADSGVEKEGYIEVSVLESSRHLDFVCNYVLIFPLEDLRGKRDRGS